MTHRVKIRHSAVAAGLGLAALGIFFFFVGIQYESDYLALEQRDQTTLAEVTAAERVEEGSDTYFELKYQFEVGGESFTRTDITGQTNQWAEVTKAAWEEASSTGTIPVYYLPEDPSINWPEQATGDPLMIAYVTEGLGAAMIVLLLGLIGRTAAEFRRAKAGEGDDYMMVDVVEETG